MRGRRLPREKQAYLNNDVIVRRSDRTGSEIGEAVFGWRAGSKKELGTHRPFLLQGSASHGFGAWRPSKTFTSVTALGDLLFGSIGLHGSRVQEFKGRRG
jgi:hypothetical protein